MNPREIKLDELENFITSLTRNLMKEHEKRFSDRTRSVREASGGLGNAGARLAQGVKNAWGAMDKQASEYGMRLAQTIQDKAQSLSQREIASAFHDVGIFHQEAVKALNEIIMTVRRYVPKLHRMLKPELATLNSSLMRLERTIVDLGTAIDGSPGLKLEALSRDAKAVQERKTELLRIRSEEDAERALLQAASTNQKETQSKRQELLSSSEFLELGNYEEALKLKEDEIRQLLAPLVKPLLKLERAAAAKQSVSVDVKTLHDLVNTPVETVVTGQRFASMQLLNTLEDNLTAGKLEILERKRRKAEDALRAVKGGALDHERDEYLALQANMQETSRQLRAKGLLGKRDELNQRLIDIGNQIEVMKSRQKDLQRKEEDLNETISKLKISIESQISKISHESVRINTD